VIGEAPGEQKKPISRRRFLGALGAGAVGAGLGGGAAVTQTAASLELARNDVFAKQISNCFTRIFPNLPPFSDQSDAVKNALLQVGAPGGLLDAKDQLSAGPVALITDPSLRVNNPDNPAHTAGITFLGQFMDHDVTFDTESKLGSPTQPQSVTNNRTPALDLDSVYGGGFVASPQLYDSVDHAKLKVESGGIFEDLPRTSSGQALLADPRNDENMIVAGLHCAFLLFHNHAVDVARAAGHTDPNDAFNEAQRLTRWHYQWIIVHEFLPLIVGQPTVDDIMASGRRYYTAGPGQALIPVEFGAAAYRFGHSMVRPSYRANLAGDGGRPFFGLIFDPSQEGRPDPSDLRGGFRAPRRFIGWQTFFDFGDGPVKRNKLIDTKISTPLFNIPLGVIPNHAAPQALPQRNLLRQFTWKMPSGQGVAGAIGAPPLSATDLGELKPYGVGLETSTPLWYYVLKEAELVAGGLHLGPVGGRIVGEVIIGLLQTDPGSYLAASPGWRPTLPMRGGGTGDFRMIDFLTFARVDPTSRGQ
jgi:hypothetical protein